MASLTIVLVAGCSQPQRSTTCANAEIARFHEYYNAGNYDAIVSDIDPAPAPGDWVIPGKEFKLWLVGTHQKIGPALDSTPKHAPLLSRDKRGTKIECDNETRFEAGYAMEGFIWRKRGNRTTLVKYGIHTLGNTPKILSRPPES